MQQRKSFAVISDWCRPSIIHLHLLVWFAYGLLYAWVPAQSIYDDARANLLTVVYVFLSTLTAITLKYLLNRKVDVWSRSVSVQCKSPNISYLFYFFVGVSALGLILHLYAKIYQLGVDYSHGLRHARGMWILLSHQYDGIASWQSALGHIFSNCFFPLVFLLLLFWERFSPKVHWFGSIYTMAVIFLYSGSMGSRSVPLFVIVFAVSIFSLRGYYRLRLLPGCTKVRYIYWIFVFSLFFCYSTFLFHEVATSAPDHEVATSAPESAVPDRKLLKDSGNQSAVYVRGFFSELFSKELPHFEKRQTLPEFIRDLYNYITLTVMYLVHSQWTFSYVMSLEQRHGTSLLNTVYAGLRQIGLLKGASFNSRDFTGRLLHLPGCAWYDYGISGLLLIAVLHGIGIALVGVNNGRMFKFSFFRSIFFVSVGVFTLLAPITSAGNLMSFPFFAISMIFLYIISILPFRQAREHNSATMSSAAHTLCSKSDIQY